MHNEAVMRNQRRRLSYVIVFVGVILVLLLVYNRGSDAPSNVVGTSSGLNIFYGIMFDAGSTGSRIHVFKFNKAPDGSYKLLDELFDHTKPGLSAYAGQPAKAAESLRPMLEKAKNYVPQLLWAETSLALKATAGLRLISNQSALAILDEVMKLFRTYPFQVADNAVAILEGEDEGLYSWFTVNLLEGALSSAQRMVGVMDLGGGSTQVTYALHQSTSSDNAANAHILDVNLLKQNFKLYTRSYLGLGLNSGRFRVLGGKESKDNMAAGKYSSACFAEGFSGHWKHASSNHSISYAAVPGKSRYDACYAAARAVILKYNMDKISNPGTGLYAISYYFDKAATAGLIDTTLGGVIKIEDFCLAAQRACETLTSSQKVFTCMDLCYICSLLHDGLGLPHTASITLRKRVGNVEIAWPLGAVFNILGQFNKITATT